MPTEAGSPIRPFIFNYLQILAELVGVLEAACPPLQNN